MSDDRERIEALLRIIDKHGLDALTLRLGETLYEVVRRENMGGQDAMPPVPKEVVAVAGANYHKVIAPIVGVFYRTSAPGAEPFVIVGDRVEVGQTVCILEAMKLMNEITSDHAGVVRRILPENGSLVSLGEELLWIES
jgi:acetyl-CoA carboxylase biotin carboxyl carrier protein